MERHNTRNAAAHTTKKAERDEAIQENSRCGGSRLAFKESQATGLVWSWRHREERPLTGVP